MTCLCWIFWVLGPRVDNEWVNSMLVLSSAHNKHVKIYKQTNNHICNFPQLDMLVVSECMIVQHYIRNVFKNFSLPDIMISN